VGTETSAEEVGNPDRLITLSDGVFAIAMTLLVLGIGVRSGLDPHAFHDALRDTVPQLLAYALSFVVLAVIWVNHHEIYRSVRSTDPTLTRLTLLSLGLIALLPFPTALIAEYGSQAASVAIYSLAVAAIDAVHLGVALYLWRRPALMETPVSSPDIRHYLEDQVSTIAVLLIAVPVAFASPAAGKYTWLALVPIKVASGHRDRRRRRLDEQQADSDGGS
jgi:uncharacterized membrane protein